MKAILDEGVSIPIVKTPHGYTQSGSGTTLTITNKTDADGDYIEFLNPTGGLSKLQEFVFSPALDLSSGGEIDFVVDIDVPGDQSIPVMNFYFTLAQTSFANSCTKSVSWDQNATGTLKQGRNILFFKIEDAPGIGGTWDYSNPITHMSLRVTHGSPVVPAGMIFKVRGLFYRCVNRPTLMLGFDDASITTYRMYKYMIGLGLKGYIPTNATRNANKLSWDQLRELDALGFTVINHGATHLDMETADYATAYTEINTMKQLIESEGIPFCPIMTYPGNHCNPDVIQAAKDLGYLFGRAGYDLQNRVVPRYGINTPFSLQSWNLETRTYDEVKAIIDKACSDVNSSNTWVYSHNLTAGNPATNASEPGDDISWWEGWMYKLALYIQSLQSAGKIQTLSGHEFVKMYSTDFDFYNIN